MSTSSVPTIVFAGTGLVVPTEAAILSGVQSDIDEAFGGGLNPALETPQGQLASSQAAIIAEKNSEIAYITNMVDPQYSSGKYQDAIGRIYFLSRKPATETTVDCVLNGLYGTVIPIGTLAKDTSGNLYSCVNGAVIGLSGNVNATFANQVTGAIPCAANTLVIAYQAVSGWDSINNPDAGVMGSDVESRSDFENRRKNSVALNAKGSMESIYANVFNVDNVLDVYVTQNDHSPCQFIGSISGTVLTVTSMISGKLYNKALVYGAGVTSGTYITSLGTGSGFGGTYNVNHSQSISSEAMTGNAAVLGSTDYVLSANTLYVAAEGGTDSDIANAIWAKKDIGCDTSGNTSVTVQDTSGYSYPIPSYTISFNRPSSLPIKFAVNLVNDSRLPSDIVTLVKEAILARFYGEDGSTRERIGASILVSRYYTPVASVSDYVSIISIYIGTSTVDLLTVNVGIDQVPTLDIADIEVTLI